MGPAMPDEKRRRFIVGSAPGRGFHVADSIERDEPQLHDCVCTAVPLRPFTKTTSTWFDVAAQVNGNTGIYGPFVRGYAPVDTQSALAIDHNLATRKNDLGGVAPRDMLDAPRS